MMDRRLQNELGRWMTAEAADDEVRAEAALSALLGSMPRLTPSPGFAERVLWASLPEPARGPAWSAWAWKLALTAALALAGLATGLLPALRLLPIGVPRASVLVKAVANGIHWVGDWLRTGFEVWDLLSRIGHAVALATGTPEAAAALAGSAILGGIALYALHHLLTLERRIVV